jgi:hypothetical protein
MQARSHTAVCALVGECATGNPELKYVGKEVAIELSPYCGYAGERYLKIEEQA